MNIHKRIIKFKPEEADRMWRLHSDIRTTFKFNKEDFINFNFNNLVTDEDIEFFRINLYSNSNSNSSPISWFKHRFIISYNEDCILCENKNVCIE